MEEQKFLDYLYRYAADHDWDEPNVKYQIRSLFTAWCLMFNVDADTALCDQVLNWVYMEAALEGRADKEAFELFMLEYLV